MVRIALKKENLNLYFDANTKPVANIKSGEEAIFECIDCYDGQIRDENTLFQDIVKEDNNPVTGPLYIESAEVGDILKIEIIDIKIASSGVMSVRPYAGAYTDIITECVSKIVQIQDDYAIFKTPQGDIKLKVNPMIGDIGVATPEPTISTIPTEYGGNLDCKFLTKGATLYLPVAVKGGLLSMGDLHALQGDGETVICGLEVDGEVHVRVTVIKNLDIPTPLIETENEYIVLAQDSSLDNASLMACKSMHRFISSYSDYSAENIGMLLSLVGDLRISQIVNGVQGCYMVLPKRTIDINFKR